MDDSDRIVNDRRSAEVIRLRLDGASTAVNTLRDQQTARGISLVCPFPSLEVDLPVSFGASGDTPMHRGAIHRIGVEDDPDTGLPRLRLSIRKFDEEQATAAVPEKKEIAAPPKNDDASSTFDDDLNPYSPALYDDDPAWVNCFDVPMPEEFAARSKTKRRYKMVSRTVWIIALAAIAGGGYALHRAGYLNLEEARSYIAGFSMSGLLGTGEGERLAAPGDDESIAPVEPADTLEKASSVDVSTAVSTTSEDLNFQHPIETTPVGEADLAEQVPAEEVEQPEPAEPPAIEKAREETEAVAESGNVSEPASADEVQLLLPTRWPVEYASGYRMRDPNGVVVDVPGGLVKREGWLDGLSDNPMIRSIKSIQRETGARFIVRVNGDLPRFMTAPKTEGVFLTLYYSEEADLGPSERVALAE